MNVSGVAKLSKFLRGEVVMPRDKIYSQLRCVKNRAVNMHPAIIARCADLNDVQLAVRFARDHELVTAVRSGGHSFAGYGVCENGLVIDLSLMKRAVLDPVHGRIRITQESSRASWIASLSPSEWQCRSAHVRRSGWLDTRSAAVRVHSRQNSAMAATASLIWKS